MSYYSPTILDHFKNPKHLGQIKDADGSGGTENLQCGDVMKVYIKVGKKDDEEYIRDIKFETMGCAAAIASSDMICEIAKGKTITQANKIRFQDIAEKLGKLPPQKLHCCHLAETALKMAIKNYEQKKHGSPSSV